MKSRKSFARSLRPRSLVRVVLLAGAGLAVVGALGIHFLRSDRDVFRHASFAGSPGDDLAPDDRSPGPRRPSVIAEARAVRSAVPPKLVIPPGSVSSADPGGTPPPWEGEPSEMAKPDIYAALQLTADQTRRAKDVLRIQTDRVHELSRALAAQEVTLPEFKRLMKELGQETDANLITVFGNEKLEAWRKYQADQYPMP